MKRVCLTYNGETLHLSEWARRLGTRHTTLRYRLRSGWPIEKVLGLSPSVGRNQHNQNPVSEDVRIAKRRASLRRATARWRANHPERAIDSGRRADHKRSKSEHRREYARQRNKNDSAKAARKHYLEKMRETIIERNRRYTQRPSVIERLRLWRTSGLQRQRHAEYQRKVRRTKWGTLNNRMSSSLHRGLRSGKQGQSWKDIVGYTISELHEHIERLFKPGMSWDNIGEWHIDHVRPISSFKFDSVHDTDFKACWAITNLQPLWALDNIRKGKKLVVCS